MKKNKYLGIAAAVFFLAWAIFMNLLGQKRELGLEMIIDTLVPILISSLVILLVLYLVNRRRKLKGDDKMDERACFIRQKAASISYSFFYITAVIAANIFLLLAKLWKPEFHLIAATLFISIVFIAVFNLCTIAYLKRKY